MLELINTYPLEQLAGKSFACDCGRPHVVFTKEILYSQQACEQLPLAMSRLFGSFVKIAIVADKNCTQDLQDVQLALGQAGFRMETKIIEAVPHTSVADTLCACSEDCKVMLAVGGGTMADLCKYACAKIGLPSAVYLCSPASDGALAPSAFLKNNGMWEIYTVQPPLLFACDTGHILRAKNVLFSAGFGNILSKYICIFDWFFSCVLTGEFYCQKLCDLTHAEIARVLSPSMGSRRRETFSRLNVQEANIRLGVIAQMVKNSRLSCGSETHAAHFCDMLFCHEKRPQRLEGEVRFLCACTLSKFYLSCLKTESRAFLPPPDNGQRLQDIVDFLGVSEAVAQQKIHPYLSQDTQALYDYKVREYRQDFVTMLEQACKQLSLASALFKRSYEDDGYWSKNYFTASDMKLILQLAPDIREKFTYLLYLKHKGKLE